MFYHKTHVLILLETKQRGVKIGSNLVEYSYRRQLSKQGGMPRRHTDNTAAIWITAYFHTDKTSEIVKICLNKGMLRNIQNCGDRLMTCTIRLFFLIDTSFKNYL